MLSQENLNITIPQEWRGGINRRPANNTINVAPLYRPHPSYKDQITRHSSDSSSDNGEQGRGEWRKRGNAKIDPDNKSAISELAKRGYNLVSPKKSIGIVPHSLDTEAFDAGSLYPSSIHSRGSSPIASDSFLSRKVDRIEINSRYPNCSPPPAPFSTASYNISINQKEQKGIREWGDRNYAPNERIQQHHRPSDSLSPPHYRTTEPSSRCEPPDSVCRYQHQWEEIEAFQRERSPSHYWDTDYNWNHDASSIEMPYFSDDYDPNESPRYKQWSNRDEEEEYGQEYADSSQNEYNNNAHRLVPHSPSASPFLASTWSHMQQSLYHPPPPPPSLPHITQYPFPDLKQQPKPSAPFSLKNSRTVKRYPSLPAEGAVPFVLCRGCFQLLQVPSHLPPSLDEGIRKLRCGSCKKLLKFLVQPNSTSFLNGLPYISGLSKDKDMSNMRALTPTSSPLEAAYNQSDMKSSPHSNSREMNRGLQQSLPQVAVFRDEEHDYHGEREISEERNNPEKSPSEEGRYLRFGKFLQGDSSVLNETLSPSRSIADSPKQNTLLSPSLSESNLQQVRALDYSPCSSSSSRNKPARHISPSDSPYSGSGMGSDFGGSSPFFGQYREDMHAEGGSNDDNEDDDDDNHQKYACQSPLNQTSTLPTNPKPSIVNTPKNLADDACGKERQSFKGYLKKGLKGWFNGSNSSHCKVVVNGHVISESDVRKAEILAGNIHPGSYWYDSRAGFWGLAGGPCLGVLPPNIKAFRHPIAADCSMGDTGVFVNGRELNHKDLQVLAKRGLPTTSGKSYIIENNGSVSDEATGKVLQSVGKLAPSVEKRGQGYGMFRPSSVQPRRG